jgi:putative flippase GtrA
VGESRLLGSQVVRFGLLSVFSFSLNLGLTLLLHEVLGVRKEVAFGAALATLLVLNFLALRYLVYQPQRPGPWLRQIAFYLPSAFGFRGGEWVAFVLFQRLTTIDYRLVIVLVLGCSMLAKFFFYRGVFGRRLEGGSAV